MKKFIKCLLVLGLCGAYNAYADYEYEIKGGSLNHSDVGETGKMSIMAQQRKGEPCIVSITLADTTKFITLAKSTPLSIYLSSPEGLTEGKYNFTKDMTNNPGTGWLKDNTGKVVVTWRHGKNKEQKKYGGLEGTLSIKRDGKKVTGIIEGKLAEYKGDPYGKLLVANEVDIKAKFSHTLATTKDEIRTGNIYLCKDK